MPRQKVILIIGIGLALITVGLIKIYLDQQAKVQHQLAKKEVEKAQASQIAVLLANKDIPTGSPVEPSSLELKAFPKELVQPGAVTSLERVSGMVTMAPIAKGEQITLGKLSYQRAPGDLAAVVPVGKRAIAVAVDNLASLGGLIKPGDYVDVIALLNIPVQTPDGKQVTQSAVMPLFQNTLVLAVGQEINTVSADTGRYKKETSAAAAPLITLALTPQEASLITFIQEQSKVRLILRSPTDATVETVAPANWETLFQYLMPQNAQQQVEKIEPEPSSYVEIYRGLNKEKVALSDK